jgi:hypothetical protein
MSHFPSDTTNNTKLEPEPPPVRLAPVAAFLKENCRKQEEDIAALADSAYVMRRGRRELQDPKRLALAVRLRSKHMADVATFAVPIRDTELCQRFVRELLAIIETETAGSPELARCIGLRIVDMSKKYQALGQTINGDKNGASPVDEVQGEKSGVTEPS